MGDVKTDIRNFYNFHKKLGEGSFGEVYKGTKIDTGETVAIKIIRLNDLKKKGDVEEKLVKEVIIMKELDHPNIVKYFDFFKDKNSYYIVMEYLDGGELFDLIQERYYGTPYNPLTHEEIVHIFKQILSAIEFLHGNLFAHRDLNFQNIVIKRKTDNIFDLEVKLIDFGLAAFVKPNGRNNSLCGSPEYIAWEIVMQQKYNAMKTDIWSLGVILYILNTGGFPWPTGSQNITFDYIKNMDWLKTCKRLFDSTKDLLEKIFVVPEERVNIKGIKDHTFMDGLALDPVFPDLEPVKNIITILVDKIVDLGNEQNDVLSSIYENRPNMVRYMYHILFEQWKYKKEEIRKSPPNKKKGGNRRSKSRSPKNTMDHKQRFSNGKRSKNSKKDSKKNSIKINAETRSKSSPELLQMREKFSPIGMRRATERKTIRRTTGESQIFNSDALNELVKNFNEKNNRK